MTLTQQQRAQLLEMHRKQWSHFVIAETLNIPAEMVDRAIGLALALERKPKPKAEPSRFRKRDWGRR